MKFYQLLIRASYVLTVELIRHCTAQLVKTNSIQTAILPNDQLLPFSIIKRYLVRYIAENQTKIPNSRYCIIFCVALSLPVINLLTKPTHYETSLF